MKNYKFFLSFILLLNSAAFGGSVDKSKSFKVSPGGNLSVSVNSGEIKINTWEKNEVLISVQGLYDDDYSQVKMYEKDNTIQVRFNGGWSDPDELTFSINVPVRFNQDLKTLSGDVTISGNVKGKVNILTQGGDIRIPNIDGNININTMGGDITAGNIGGNADINTSGGDIKFGNVSGYAEISTMGGDITGGDISRNASVKTHGGDIKIGNSGGQTDIYTYGGDIIVKFISGNCKLNTHGGDIQLSGAKGSVNAKSSGGDLKLMNITGSVEANTASGDITAEITSVNSDSRIITQSGGIILNISEKVNAEISANIKLKGSYISDEDIDILSDFKSRSREKNRKSVKDSFILNGGGVKIYLESTNSGIEIRKLTRS